MRIFTATMLLTAALFAATAGLAPGTPVPDISAPNQDGKVIRLADLRGRPVLLYFYPKDDTPGCTAQACALRDDSASYEKANVTILGVSKQDGPSHKAFKAKHRLPFDLLSDMDGAFAKALGVDTIFLVGWHKRQSVLIGADGKVMAFLGDVSPVTHSHEILELVAKGTPEQRGTPPAPAAKPEASPAP